MKLHQGQNESSREKGWNGLQMKGEVVGPPQEILWKAERRRESWVPLRRRNCILSCDLSLGSPSSFLQVLLSVKSYTCLFEWVFVVETKAALFHIWHGIDPDNPGGSRKPTRQRRLREQRKTGPPQGNVAEILFYFPQAQLLKGQK